MSQSALMRLALCSQSPRRKELLSHLGIPFDIYNLNIDESCHSTDPKALVLELASLKGEFAAKKLGDIGSLFLTADTIVFLDEVLGKPVNREQAESFLKKLSGRTHQVFTGVCFSYFNKTGLKQYNFFEESQVTFDTYDTEAVNTYLNFQEYHDKAGGYGIQGAALAIINHLEGCYANVMGLPLNRLKKEFLIHFKTQSLKEIFYA